MKTIAAIISITLLFCSGLFVQNVNAEPQIPTWVKNVAKWWSNGQITDSDLVNNIKYITERKIVSISESEQDNIILLDDKEDNSYAKSLLKFEVWESEIANIVIVGDVGITANSQKTLYNIEKSDPDLIIFAGDLSYSTPEEWFNFSDFLGIDRTVISIGNHEALRHPASDWLSHYELQRQFYSFDYERIHFLILSSETDYSPDSEQIKFIKNDLRSAKMNPMTKWIIVVIHKPLYSSPTTPSVITSEMINLRNSFQPIFDAHHVDMVIQGHVHAYERTKPLMFDGIITDNSTISHTTPTGQIYVTVGTGGHSHVTYTGMERWVVIQNAEDFGFLQIRLLDNGNRISGEFITNDRNQKDFFQINRFDDSRKSVDLSADLIGKDLSWSDLSGVDLSGKDLRGVKLMGADLSNADLSGVDLSGKDLSWSDLSGVDLSGKDLRGVKLMGVDLTGKDLSGVKLMGVDLTGKDLRGVKLMGVDLTGKDLRGVKLMGADLSNADLSGVDLSGKDLRGVKLMGADLSNADLSGVDLSGKDLRGVKLMGADLSNADLSGVDLSGKDLSGVKLMGVDLTGKDLSWSDLSGVDLSGMDLSGADLSGVDLTGKDLTRGVFVHTNFSKAKMQKTIFSQSNMTQAIFQEADLTEAILMGTFMNHVNFTNAKLTDTLLQGSFLNLADLTYADLSNANLSGAHLENANLKGTNLEGAKLTNANLDGANLGCINHPICN